MESWEVEQVCQWLDSIGLGNWEQTFSDNRITGDLLIHADHEMLKELDMPIGPRIALLKAIYHLKLEQGIKVEGDDYIPETGRKESEGVLSPIGSDLPSAHFNNVGVEMQESSMTQRLESMILERDLVIERLVAEQRNLTAEVAKLREELKPVWILVEEYRNFQQTQKSSRHHHASTSHDRSPEVPVKVTREESLAISQRTNQHSGSASSSSSNAGSVGAIKNKSPVKNASKVPGSHFTSLAKGSPLSKSADELPVMALQTPGANTSPMSPIKMLDMDWGAIRVYGHRLPGRENVSYKSFKVNINDNCIKVIPEVLKKYKIDDTWHHYALFVTFKDKERCLSFDEKPLQIVLSLKDGENMPEFIIKHLKQVNSPGTRSNTSSVLYESGKPSTVSSLSKSNPNHKKDSSAMTDVDSAVAIYEYKAQRPDELNVVIGDKFHVVSRETGWYIVEKDGVQGWVPAGCLLERNDPGEDVDVANGKVLKGIVLYDYEKNSPNELTVKKGGQVLIHKQFQHWMLVDYDDQNGWVPSCYVSVDAAGPGTAKSSITSLKIPANLFKSSDTRARSATTGSAERLPNLSNQVSMPMLKSQTSPLLSPTGRLVLPMEDPNTRRPSRHSRSASLSSRLERTPPTAGPDNNALSKLSNLLDSINPLLTRGGDSSSSSLTTSARPSVEASSQLQTTTQARICAVLDTLTADVEFWSKELKAENAQAKSSAGQLGITADLLATMTKYVDEAQGDLSTPTGLLLGLEQLVDDQRLQKFKLEKLKQADSTNYIQTKQERVDLITSSIYSICTRLQNIYDSVNLGVGAPSAAAAGDQLSSSFLDPSARELASDYKAFSTALGIWASPQLVSSELPSTSNEPSLASLSFKTANGPVTSSNTSFPASVSTTSGPDRPVLSKAQSSPTLPDPTTAALFSSQISMASSTGTASTIDNASGRSSEIQLPQKLRGL